MNSADWIFLGYATTLNFVNLQTMEKDKKMNFAEIFKYYNSKFMMK